MLESLAGIVGMNSLGAVVFSAFLIGLTGALMPGPVLTTTIAHSAQRGAITGPAITLGHAVPEVLLLIAVSLGLAPVFGMPWFKMLVGMAGGATLVWMGAGMILSVGKLSLSPLTEGVSDGSAGGSRVSLKRIVFDGAVTSVTNPYWTIWWATAGLEFLRRSHQTGALGIPFFFVGHISADLVWYALVAAAVAQGRRFMSDKVYRTIVVVCAVAIAGFGVFFLWDGLKMVWGG